MSPDPAVTTSLRRSLLRRLAAPLSMLALMSGLIAYWLAWQYTQHVIDRSLADLATAISKQIQIAGPDAPFTVPPLAQAMFSDPAEAFRRRRLRCPPGSRPPSGCLPNGAAAAAHSRLPVGRITEVRVLDPYLRV